MYIVVQMTLALPKSSYLAEFRSRGLHLPDAQITSLSWGGLRPSPLGWCSNPAIEREVWGLWGLSRGDIVMHTSNTDGTPFRIWDDF